MLALRIAVESCLIAADLAAASAAGTDTPLRTTMVRGLQ
jgi:hypothetical protein